MNTAKICVHFGYSVNFLILENLTDGEIEILNRDNGSSGEGIKDEDTEGLNLVCGAFIDNKEKYNARVVEFKECCEYQTNNIFNFSIIGA